LIRYVVIFSIFYPNFDMRSILEYYCWWL